MMAMHEMPDVSTTRGRQKLEIGDLIVDLLAPKTVVGKVQTQSGYTAYAVSFYNNKYLKRIFIEVFDKEGSDLNTNAAQVSMVARHMTPTQSKFLHNLIGDIPEDDSVMYYSCVSSRPKFIGLVIKRQKVEIGISFGVFRGASRSALFASELNESISVNVM